MYTVCYNCGKQITDKYCSHCGQKKFTPEDLSFKKMVLSFLEDFYKVDLNVTRTLKVLLFSPGTLSLYYISGKIVSYVKPFKLYLFTSLFVFFLGILLNKTDFTFTMSELSEYKGQIEHIALENHISDEVVLEKINTKYDSYQPIFLLILILSFALILWIIFRDKYSYFSSHLIFSLHFFTAALYMILLSFILEHLYRDIYYLFYYVLPLIYLFFALRKFYTIKDLRTFLLMIPLFTIYILLQLSWVYIALIITLYTI